MNQDYQSRLRHIFQPYLTATGLHVQWNTVAESKQHLAAARLMKK